jgi:hypothetical protein
MQSQEPKSKFPLYINGARSVTAEMCVCVRVNWDRILGLRVYEPGFNFEACVNKLRLNFYSSVHKRNLCFEFLPATCCIRHHHWDIATGLKKKHAIESKPVIMTKLHAGNSCLWIIGCSDFKVSIITVSVKRNP